MDAKKFREVEQRYQELKSKHDRGEIDGEDMKKELKRLLLTDESGNYWMIGGKSGQWYRYDGREWSVSDPFGEAASIRESPQGAPPVTEGVDEKADVQKRGAPPGDKTKKPPKTTLRSLREDELLIKYVNIVSLIFFLGGLGMISGVILGASFGIFKIGGDLIAKFPAMLQGTHGKIQGGLLFGALGGILGFFACAFLAIVMGLVYNLVSYIFGGIRFRIRL